MVNWHQIEVPYLEWSKAQSLGAERSNKAWWCTATQYKHRLFRRWHTTASHKRVVIYPGGLRPVAPEFRELLRGCDSARGNAIEL